MYDLPSMDHVSKVVVDETVIESNIPPLVLYDNTEKNGSTND
jgi:ATP-dependent Clp protease ATP-binding subunit ClpX